MANRFALIGWSLPVNESMLRANTPFVVLSFPGFAPDAVAPLLGKQKHTAIKITSITNYTQLLNNEMPFIES